MLAKTESVAFIGTEARLVAVEVDVKDGGLPTFRTVGLAATSVREAEQRTRSAIETSGGRWPKRRIIANLAPGGLRKEGTHFDLPIALGVLAADAQVDRAELSGWIVLGELALDGTVRAVRGVLPAAIACREWGKRGLICPAANAQEASLIDDVEIIPVRSLSECMSFLHQSWVPPRVMAVDRQPVIDPSDMSDVRGHREPKAALEIAAAGGHNILMMGPPGSGKTMLARRMPTILPPMDSAESLEVTRIYSVAGLLDEHSGLVVDRPFRSPHHHISVAAMIGGGSGLARPGEVSLAHFGLLFLDEVTLFSSAVLEALRGPMEDRVVRIARSEGTVAYPCLFSMVAAMNPCPCGFADDPDRDCECDGRQLRTYGCRLSGPFLDRIDMQVKVSRLTDGELLRGDPSAETSAAIRERVELARLVQADRYGSILETNATAELIVLEASLTSGGRSYFRSIIDQLYLGGRAVTRVLRVARTIADLAGDSSMSEIHIAHALNFRLDQSQGVPA